MRQVSHVFEIRDRPGERCLGKMYVPSDGEDEEYDVEWLSALAEADRYMDQCCVDEAIDVGNEFGI